MLGLRRDLEEAEEMSKPPVGEWACGHHVQEPQNKEEERGTKEEQGPQSKEEDTAQKEETKEDAYAIANEANGVLGNSFLRNSATRPPCQFLVGVFVEYINRSHKSLRVREPELHL